MNKMRSAMYKQLELIQAHERVILRRWYRAHVVEIHLNDGRMLKGVDSWDIEELIRTVECHGGNVELLLERAKSAAIYQMTEGVY